MNRKQIILLGIFLASLNAMAQSKKLNYAEVPIDVPAGYKTDSDTAASGENFTVQWTCILKVMYESNVHKQMIHQAEVELHGKFISGMRFFSQGAEMSGRLYQVKSDTPIKYKVLASGVVNNKPVVLNMGFSKLPKQDSDLDDFMRKFIDFEQ